MTQVSEIYKCNICGNVVEVKQAGDGDLVCCGQNMELLTGDDAAPYLTPPSMKPGGP